MALSRSPAAGIALLAITLPIGSAVNSIMLGSTFYSLGLGTATGQGAAQACAALGAPNGTHLAVLDGPDAQLAASILCGAFTPGCWVDAGAPCTYWSGSSPTTADSNGCQALALPYICAWAPPSYPWRWPVYTPPSSSNLPPVSLPEAWGIMDDVEYQWWYFAGHTIDSFGHTFSLYMQLVLIFQCSRENAAAQFILTIGDGADKKFYSDTAIGVGASSDPNANAAAFVSTPTPTSFSFHSNANATWLTPPTLSMAFKYAGGALLGDVGATYTIQATTATTGVNLTLVDARGTVLSGMNGAVKLPEDRTGLPLWQSIEFAQPRLQVQAGGTVTVGGRAYEVSGGNLWQDRQTLTYPPDQDQGCDTNPMDARKVNDQGPGVYRGRWLAINLDNGVTIAVWQMLKPHTNASHYPTWVTGKNLGVQPATSSGTVFLPLSVLDPTAPDSTILLSNSDIDIAVTNLHEPLSSPHWTSKATGVTYATALRVAIPKLSSAATHNLAVPSVMYIKVLIPSAEFIPGGFAFAESAALVYSDYAHKRPVGRAFVEQFLQ